MSDRARNYADCFECTPDTGHLNREGCLLFNEQFLATHQHPQDQLHHTIITIDIASYTKLNEGAVAVLAEYVHEGVWESHSVTDDADEWKVTVKQVAPNGTVTGVDGWRQS